MQSRTESSSKMDMEKYIFNKWESLFRFLNRSGSGILTMEEMMEFPSHLMKMGKIDLGVRLARMYKEHFDRICMAVDRPTSLKCIGLKDYAKGQSIVTRDTAYYKEFINGIGWTFVELMDQDGDGVISIKEWRMYYNAQGVHDEGFIKASFTKMDTNEDGFIDTREFVRALKAFNYAHDPAGNDFSFLYETNKDH